MTPKSESRAPGFLEARSLPAQWGILIAGSMALAALFAWTRLPAALLLGPMVAGILVGSNGATVRPPRAAVFAAQTVVGCLIARSITADIVHAFVKDWPLFLAVVLAIVATSVLTGWMLSRVGALPGTTAVWGSAPGGASVMMVMSGEFGADARLVAFMQYLRVVLVAAIASVVARLWIGAPDTAAATAWFPVMHWGSFLATLAIAGAGGAIGYGFRIPAGSLLVPMLLGAVLEAMGLVVIVLPPWLLALSYAFLGWSVGLSFTRNILLHAARALPQILLSILVLVGACGALAMLLVRAAGIDPMTAYLATSPGGMDSVAIIGAASNADLSFVMGLQIVRLVIVLLAGPALARFVSRRMGSG